MAKNSVPEWDISADSNTDIAGINIGEGCPPSGINNAIRALMAQIKAWLASAGGPLLKAGGTMTGAIKAMGNRSSIQDPEGGLQKVGYRSLPRSRVVAAQVTLGRADEGRRIHSTAGGLIVPAEVVEPVPGADPDDLVNIPIDSLFSFYNDSGSTKSITAQTGVTLRLAGSTSTGTRTVQARGLASLLKLASNEWLVMGNVT
jgi:hypothetical protein